MRPKVSNALIREVLFRIVVSVDSVNRERYPKLAYKFFVWAGQQEGYRHNTSMYNVVMKVFAECGEVKAMWRLLEEMAEKGLPVSARTFHLLICSSGKVGLRRRLVERFIKLSTFRYRPFRNAFNAILHTLLTIEQYSLIEWVHEKMILEGHSPDILTYNIVMRAKYMLGKLDQFHRLLDEMGQNGFTPDLHTYNLLLHVLGKGDKPLAALNLLNYMSDVGCVPNVLHFTNLIDGLGRAGNLEACRYFFDEMVKKGCEPDVVCYTVMITSYVAAGEFEEAQRFFDDMLVRGQLPNVYTYNSMIGGLCTVGEFDKAFSMLKDMELHGCTPNFSVYSSLVSRLRNAGKDSQANNVIKYMTDKGHYLHLLSRFGGYKRC
jgi:pentatricopeptide repeat protein